MRVFAIDERTTAAELLQMARKKFAPTSENQSRFILVESVNIIEERPLEDRELVNVLTSRWLGNSRRLLFKDRSVPAPSLARDVQRVMLADGVTARQLTIDNTQTVRDVLRLMAQKLSISPAEQENYSLWEKGPTGAARALCLDDNMWLVRQAWERTGIKMTVYFSRQAPS